MNTTLTPPLSGIQYLSVCQYINSFGIFFSSIALLPFNEKDQPVVVLNALFRHLNNSKNETQAKTQLLERALEETNLYKDRENMTLEITYVNKTFQYIITAVFFANNVTRYVSSIVSVRNTGSTIFKDHFRKYLSCLSISNSLCSSNNRTSKLTALSIDKLLDDFILPALNRGIKKGFVDVQQENLPVLKRSKRQMNRNLSDSVAKTQESPSLEMENMDVSLNDAETYDDPNFLPKEQYHENLSASDLLHVLDEIKYNSDDDDNYLKFANDMQSVLQMFENNKDHAFEIPTTSKKSTIPPLQPFETPKSNINSIPETIVVDNLDDVSANEYLPPAKVPKIDKRKYDSKVEIPDGDDVPGTSKRVRVSPLQGYERFVTEELEKYDFEHMLRDIRVKGLESLKQNKENYRKFQLKLYRILRDQLKYPIQHEFIDLWCSETTNRTNIIQLLNSLEGKTFFFNDITLLRRINNKEWPYQPPPPDSPIYKIYYDLSISSLDGFIQLKDSRNSNESYLTFPEKSFIVEYTQTLKDANTTILIIKLVTPPKSIRWSEVRDKTELLSEKEKLNRKQSIEKAANLISSVVPMHTLIESLNILKHYILKLKESDSPVPTYDQLAKEYCNNLNESKRYKRWKIRLPGLIEDILFKTNLNIELNTRMSNRVGKETKFGKTYWNNALETYNNSSVLQKSLVFYDYFLLQRFIKKNLIQKSTKLQMSAALYRLALRQCDDYNNEIPITLYRAVYQDIPMYPTYYARSERLDEQILFHFYSTKRNLEEELSNASKSRLTLKKLIKLKLDNRAGIVDLDIITGTTDGMYCVLDELTVDVVANESVMFDGKPIPFVKIHDKRVKEDKMIEMVRVLKKLKIDYQL